MFDGWEFNVSRASFIGGFRGGRIFADPMTLMLPQWSVHASVYGGDDGRPHPLYRIEGHLERTNVVCFRGDVEVDRWGFGVGLSNLVEGWCEVWGKVVVFSEIWVIIVIVKYG